MEQQPGFFARLGLAFKVLGDASLAAQVERWLNKPEPAKGPAAKAIPQEKTAG